MVAGGCRVAAAALARLLGCGRDLHNATIEPAAAGLAV
jgi:hypothetical protein